VTAARRIVLVGFMAAGKTAVGRLLAAELGWDFLDLDRVIEEAAGRSVAAIFAEEGEAGFRAREAEATAVAARRLDAVLAPGGGWVLQPELMQSVRCDGVVVWLQVTAAEAVRRAWADGIERPLLKGPQPLERASDLLRQREALYRQADLVIDTTGRSARDVADEVLQLLGLERKQHGG
jgi:shikimate kinase